MRGESASVEHCRWWMIVLAFQNLDVMSWMSADVFGLRTTWGGLQIWEGQSVFGTSWRVLLAAATRLLAKDRDERRIPILDCD